MLDAGACPSKPTYLNKIPLYIAAENNFVECVKILLPKSTKDDVLRSTNYGTTALFIAQRNGNPHIKRMLSEFCLAATEVCLPFPLLLLLPTTTHFFALHITLFTTGKACNCPPQEKQKHAKRLYGSLDKKEKTKNC